MTALDKLRAASPEVRELTLALLDEISRPMTVREIDHAFAMAGIPRSDRRPMIRALKPITIIAVHPSSAVQTTSFWRGPAPIS